ncbi:MAG: glycosyltransferase family 2 protein, partial [Acidobacteriaceae bacterium]
DEIIVVDDQSTDNSVSVIRSLIGNEPRARLIESHIHRGTVATLNEGLHHACGDYVLFLSSNDFVLPGIFARAKSCLTRERPPGLWSAMVLKVDENDRFIGMHFSPVVSLHDTWFPPEKSRQLAYRLGNWFTGTTLMFYREALQEVGGLDPEYGGLSDLLAALTIASQRGAAYSPEPLGVMRVHANGFLSRTLLSVTGLESIIDRIHERGPQMERGLYTPRFLSRTADRFRFAATRTMGASRLPDLASRYGNPRSVLLRIVDRYVAPRLTAVRIAFIFLILRPFDVFPTLWYRFIGATIIWLRVRWSGKRLYPKRSVVWTDAHVKKLKSRTK